MRSRIEASLYRIEARSNPTPNQVAWALQIFDSARSVLTLSGSAPAHRAELLGGIMAQLRAHPEWSFKPLEDLYTSFVGKAAPADRSLRGVIGMIFDIAGGSYNMRTPTGYATLSVAKARQGFTDKAAFVEALNCSAAKIHASLQAISMAIPQTTVIAVDGDLSPARGARRGAGDTLSTLCSMLVHNPTDVRLVVTGKAVGNLLPANAPFSRVNAIELV